jgi:hypothetical protein
MEETWKRVQLDLLSEMEEVRGTDPVSSTTIIPRVRSVMPNEREKYSSRTGLMSKVCLEYEFEKLTCRLSDLR